MFTDGARETIEADITEEREIIAKIEANNDLSVLEKLARDNTQIAKENAIRAIFIRMRESKTYGKISDGAKLAIGASLIEFVKSTWPTLIGLFKSYFGLV